MSAFQKNEEAISSFLIGVTGNKALKALHYFGWNISARAGETFETQRSVEGAGCDRAAVGDT